MHFFNWLFDIVIPWANNSHPENLSKFHLPRSFPGIVDINRLEMYIRDNYLVFGLDPTFIG